MTDEEKFVLHDPELFVGDNALARRGEPLHVWGENTSATCLTEATEMTNEELVKRLRDTYDLVKMWPEKQPDGFTNLLVLRNLVPDTADRIEALTKERNALRSALNRIRPIPERILRGIPVRDLAETLAEADSALIKGESHE